MIGLSIVLGLIGILYFATTLDVIKASEGSQEEKEDKTITHKYPNSRTESR